MTVPPSAGGAEGRGSPPRAWVPPRGAAPSALAWLSPRRFSALYVWLAMLIVFAFWVPETFFTATNLKVVLAGQAVTAILALGLTVALAAGALDLAASATLGFCGMVASLLMVDEGLGTAETVVAGLGAGLLVGVVNSCLVSGLGISSIIATLGMSSVMAGLVIAFSGNQQVVGLDQSFLDLGTSTILGIALPVWIMVAVALVTWFVLEHTAAGRYTFATGSGPEAARLSGVRTWRYVSGALIVSAVLAALAGILATARIGAGDPSLGPAYLLPAFAAAFLGSTQIVPGRFNAWGTVAAVYVIATGVQGLQLAGAPTWLPSVFNGVALLLAVGLTTARAQFRGRSRFRRGGSARLRTQD